ncbi:amino acid adenylation domain-containing protein [Massilia sp. METH4]|uniref:amino acid adenylation domain-containing protein n=1 Tax=Massilia sp. METH4 TaxID=3123041 RepID=UPI0030CAEA3A
MTAAPPCIHRRFERQAAHTPHAVALQGTEESLSYADLNAAANRLARCLQRRGARPGALVALCLERGAALVTAMLAVLKTGAAYVPVDPAYPAARIAFMLADAEPAVTVTRGDCAGQLAPGRATLLLDRAPWAQEDDANLARDVDAGSLAYVMYTSGSTGQPKGVLVEHRQLSCHVDAFAALAGLSPRDRVLQFAAPAFDVLAEEVWPTLLHGATLVLRDPGPADALAAFTRQVAARRITVLNLPASFWHPWCDHVLASDGEVRLPALRQLIVGSEVVQPGSVRAWQARFGTRVAIANAYGPTEATVTATAQQLPLLPPGAARVPIGRPLAGTIVRVLGAARRPVAPGEPGELYIGGTRLARGYLNRPDLTAERFVHVDGERLYRTGDLAALLPDGSLDFLGRIDRQLKVHGHRVEPGDVEACLVRHLGVGSAVVVADASTGQLLAYVTPADGATPPAAAELRAMARAALPPYMVPAAYVCLPALPLTANGKLDRGALPAPDAAAFPEQDYDAPQGEAERELAALWCALLRLPSVGRHDDFFALGGDAPAALGLVDLLRERGHGIDMRAFCLRPTVAALAALPSSLNALASLPSSLNALASLPSSLNALASLPSSLNALASLPSSLDALASLPSSPRPQAALPPAPALQDNPAIDAAFFQSMLQGAPPPVPPFGLDGVHATDLASRHVDPALALRLRAVARRHGVMPAGLFHLAWACVLARGTGRRDVVFDSLLPACHTATGMGECLLPVRLALDGAGAVAALRHTHARLALLLDHRHLPYRARESTLLHYRHQGTEVPPQAGYPLAFTVDDLGDGFRLAAQCAAAAGPARICDYMLCALQALADALEHAPDTPIAALDVMPPAERAQLLRWAAPSAFPDRGCLHRLVEAVAARTPHAVALTCGGTDVTYAALNDDANRLAHHLQALGVAPEVAVALCLPAGVPFVVAALGVLKAGGACMPFDAAVAHEHLAAALGEAGARIVLADRQVDIPSATVLRLNGPGPWQAMPRANPASAAVSSHLAWIVRGADGASVGLEHRNITRLFPAAGRWLDTGAADSWAVCAGPSSARFLWELWGGLLAGGRAVLVPAAVAAAPAALARFAGEQKVTVLTCRSLADAADVPPGVRHLILHGKTPATPVVADWRRRHPRGARVFAMHGSAGTGVYATCRPLDAGAPDHAGTLGHPLPDMAVFVLDAHGLPAPIGVPGELHVGGAGVGRLLDGSRQRHGRFVTHPLAGGERLFRTGMQVRWLVDGTLDGQPDGPASEPPSQPAPRPAASAPSGPALPQPSPALPSGVDRDAATRLPAAGIWRPRWRALLN